MRLLALDQASRISGWAVFNDGQLHAHGIISANQNDIGDRLYHIRKEVIKLINQYDIDEVIFEDIQLQTNIGNSVTTFKALAEVFGVLNQLFTELKIPQTAVLASVWKSALGIKGKDRPTQKKAAQTWVIKNYNIQPSQDECDAICIGAYYNQNKVESFDWS